MSSNCEVRKHFRDIRILTESDDMTIAALVATFAAHENLSCDALLKKIIRTIYKQVEFSRVKCYF